MLQICSGIFPLRSQSALLGIDLFSSYIISLSSFTLSVHLFPSMHSSSGTPLFLGGAPLVYPNISYHLSNPIFIPSKLTSHYTVVRYHKLSQHQHKTLLSRRNCCVRVDALRPSYQRHPDCGLLRTRCQYDTSHCISSSDGSFSGSSRTVGILL